jgi:hypothetical protein
MSVRNVALEVSARLKELSGELTELADRTASLGSTVGQALALLAEATGPEGTGQVGSGDKRPRGRPRKGSLGMPAAGNGGSEKESGNGLNADSNDTEALPHS